MEKKIIHTDKAPKAIGAYVQATNFSNLLFTSGQLGFDPATTEIVKGGIEAETKQALENLKAILVAAGSDLKKVIKTTIFLANINDFAAFNAIYASYFNENPPSRTAVQAGALPRGALVEIEAVAFI
jgi:2-iminobutanoate/2-iminopropanoate deaminase